MPKRTPQERLPVDLRPESWRPSPERQAQIEDLLWDREIMRVYCDCSASKRIGAFGLAAAYVYDGSVTVRSRKLYSKDNLQPVYGELHTILYAIQQLSVVLKGVPAIPTRIAVFSDVADIDHLLSAQGTGNFAAVAKQIAAAHDTFTSRWEEISLTISAMPTEEKRHNPFYVAAHNGARKEVLIERR